jgi:hypothetical protein
VSMDHAADVAPCENGTMSALLDRRVDGA